LPETRESGFSAHPLEAASFRGLLGQVGQESNLQPAVLETSDVIFPGFKPSE
jgi:hypothetical protein